MVRPIVAVKVINATRRVEKVVYAMLDSGSDRDIVSKDLATDMDLIQHKKSVTVQTIDASSTAERRFTDFRLESLDESYGADVEGALVGFLLTSENDRAPAKRRLDKWPHAKGISFENHDAGVHVILGAAHAEAWMGAELRRGPPGAPHFLKTLFGWTAVGGGGGANGERIGCLATSVDNDGLRNDFRRIFEQDFKAVSEAEIGDSVENKEAIEQLKKTITFDLEKGKYRVGLPWKRGRENATKILNALDSRQMALKRLYGMIPRFNRDAGRKERVFNEMQKFEDKQYAVQIADVDDRITATTPRWHLPLHVVEKNNKCRICHDGRANVKGICVNDLLSGSPNLLNSLPGILLNFRTKKIAFMTDIASFFHQVLVDERDAESFCYFWFSDESMKSHKMLRFNAHIFGSGASSLVTSFVLRHHAEVIKPDFPENVYNTIRDCVYVDDVSGGADKKEEAMELKENLKEALGRGGFSLAKWKSNWPELLAGEESTPTKSLGETDEDHTKVLGVEWETREDVFTFYFNDENLKREVKTPRDIVSIQASLFDPLGFVAPFILIGRRLLQKSMAGNASWDSPLDETLKKEF